MKTLNNSLFVLLLACLLVACEKENLEETIIEEEEITISIQEVDPGQAIFELSVRSQSERMRFDSTSFFTRTLGDKLIWSFNAEVSALEEEAFSLNFSSATLSTGTYSVSRFTIDESVDTDQAVSFAGTYGGDNLDLKITIDEISDENGVTGTLRGSFGSANCDRTLIGRFANVPFN